MLPDVGGGGEGGKGRKCSGGQIFIFLLRKIGFAP